jgi:hypothetical protein
MNNLWEQIVYDLQGTCNTLYGVLNHHEAEHLENNEQFLNYVDQHIFLCDTCGWWCEVSELSENEQFNECTDCNEDH